MAYAIALAASSGGSGWTLQDPLTIWPARSRSWNSVAVTDGYTSETVMPESANSSRPTWEIILSAALVAA
jgi:hypothetical protein